MTEEELISACKNRENGAFKRLYEQYAKLLMGIAMRYTRNVEDAEDILQNTFIKVFRKIDNYNSNGSFEGWMKRILINTAINYINRGNKLQKLTNSNHVDEYEIEDDTLLREKDAKELLKLIQKLPEGYRVVFNLYLVEGYEHKEISEMLGISEGTSKSQLYKAKKMFKNFLIEYKLVER